MAEASCLTAADTLAGLVTRKVGMSLCLLRVCHLIIILRAHILLYCILFKKFQTFQTHCSFSSPSYSPSSPTQEGALVGGWAQ